MILLRALKMDAERNLEGSSARTMAEFRMAEIQGNIDREAELEKNLEYQKEETAFIKQQKERAIASHKEELHRIAEEEDASYWKAKEMESAAQEQRAASSHDNVAQIMMDLAEVERQEKERRAWQEEPASWGQLR